MKVGAYRCISAWIMGYISVLRYVTDYDDGALSIGVASG